MSCNLHIHSVYCPDVFIGWNLCARRVFHLLCSPQYSSTSAWPIANSQYIFVNKLKYHNHILVLALHKWHGSLMHILISIFVEFSQSPFQVGKAGTTILISPIKKSGWAMKTALEKKRKSGTLGHVDLALNSGSNTVWPCAHCVTSL